LEDLRTQLDRQAEEFRTQLDQKAVDEDSHMQSLKTLRADLCESQRVQSQLELELERRLDSVQRTQHSTYTTYNMT
jgi:hypothetical protein